MSDSYERHRQSAAAAAALHARHFLGAAPEALAELRHWLAMARLAAQLVDLDAAADAAGALGRRRGAATPVQVLALALMHGPGGATMRDLCATADELDVMHSTEPTMLRRLLHAAGWIEQVADRVMIEQLVTLSSAPDAAVHGVSLRPYGEWQYMARTARQFVEDLVPWPNGSFNDAQAQWLMCVRWNFMASTLKSGRGAPHELGDGGTSVARLRRVTHLLAAVLPDLPA